MIRVAITAAACQAICSNRQVRAMFEEQVGWAAEAGVDYIIAETISWLGEAELALDVIRRAKLPAVVTYAPAVVAMFDRNMRYVA